MKSTFPGMPKEALSFFRELRRNNNRDWFEAHKDTYLTKVKAPAEQLAAIVSAGLTKFAPAFATEPKKALFRIYRDTRFSNDKTPYKDHVGALFYRGDLPKNESAGYYFGISDKSLGIAGGCYGPGPDQLKAIRSHLLEHHARFSKLVAAKPLAKALGTLQGERLSRPPKGFMPDTPGIEWIKAKQWYYYVELDPKTVLGPEVADEILTRFKLVSGVVDFLNEPLLAARKRSKPLLDLF
jgi:uncharacterized protein (TIGR02453 family)